MPEIAHTRTYNSYRIKDIFHRLRMKHLKRLARDTFAAPSVYCDIGSSEGFITQILANAIDADGVHCYDGNPKLIELGREKTGFEFFLMNLNDEHQIGPYPAVTCLETLEHVGALEVAVLNVLRARAPDGKCIISVPNEIGWIGLVKAIAKLFIYRYSLNQLNPGTTRRQYLWNLITDRERISVFRGSREKGYGTHFGFDYRDVDDIIKKNKLEYRMIKSGTTVFFVIG